MEFAEFSHNYSESAVIIWINLYSAVSEWKVSPLLLTDSINVKYNISQRNVYTPLHNIPYLLHFPMCSTSNTTSTTSTFQAIFDAALKDYTKKTGKDLYDLGHPLASKLDSCDGPDSILDIFREQAREFDEFRKGDTKLFKWLKPIVKVLHTISTNDVLVHSASSVNPAKNITYYSCH